MAKSEYIFGLHAVQSLLKTAPLRVEKLFVLRGRDDQRVQKILQMAQGQGIAWEWQTRKEMDARSAEGNHQGIIAVAKPGQLHDETFLYQLVEEAGEPILLLILDGVTDPHNLGACLRSADAVGVQAVIIPKDNSAGLTETARKVACGAADSVPLVSVTNLARCLQKLQELGVWLVGTCGDASETIYELKLTGNIALIMGAEGSGMRRLTREHCDYLAHIPMCGSVSSLNVSVATGVCLFEALRQRRL
ncbi:MAG TPA: 23S rRNA (guanosine(2251)-2'-O)-methyltransferase RlmB [Cellvibrionaceae bacterium]